MLQQHPRTLRNVTYLEVGCSLVFKRDLWDQHNRICPIDSCKTNIFPVNHLRSEKMNKPAAQQPTSKLQTQQPAGLKAVRKTTNTNKNKFDPGARM
jgi:hypothetical protein